MLYVIVVHVDILLYFTIFVQALVLCVIVVPVHVDIFFVKALVLCFRLHFTKDSTTINTAAATVRQLVFVVFERVEAEDKTPNPGQAKYHKHLARVRLNTTNT